MAFDPDGQIEQAIVAGAKKYPREEGGEFKYGTAGFRMKEWALDYVVFTVGILASLRSRKVGARAIGVMITASHNPAVDNGVKLVDPQGNMLDQEWEQYAAYIANAKTPEETRNAYGNIVQELKIPTNNDSIVIVARDTRPSGERLNKALIAGAKACNAKVVDFGILTTPQLHYMVLAYNTQDTPHPYGEISEEGYYKKLAAAFKKAMDGAPKPQGSVSVDCANGVGAPSLKKMKDHLPSEEEGGVKIRVFNDNIDDPAMLNEKCGADFVKTQQRVPDGYVSKAYDRWCSYDGDADRVVYYYNEEGPVFRMLDGDRIATLAANFIGELVSKAGLAGKLNLAVVQTAYANGSSTKYIENTLKLKTVCTNTGVKHLHHEATLFDIGVYFEANGHGTVLFGPTAMKRIYNHDPQSPAQLEALETLKSLTDLINQTVGDAISDMLLVEVILAHKEWTVREWLNTYTDLPNRLGKVKVYSRDSYKTVPGSAERRLQEPSVVQQRLDEIVAKYKDGRCFVRASGTEDAVRVYGEAAEAYDCDDMVAKVLDMIASISAIGVKQ